MDAKDAEMGKRFNIMESLVKDIKSFAGTYDEKVKRMSDHTLNQLNTFQRSQTDNMRVLT